MPADRRIIVQIMTEGFRDPELQGEFVPGTVTDYPAWARRRDVNSERRHERGGTRSETTRDWRIRWHSLIDSTPVTRLKVVDGGETFNIINMVEVTEQRGGAPDLRRKWIDLSGVSTP